MTKIDPMQFYNFAKTILWELFTISLVFRPTYDGENRRRVLRLVPGLENAEFLRFGMMHRNTYVNAPELLQPTMQYRRRSDLFFAGQIVGVEGYMGNAASGLVAGINAARFLSGKHPVIFPTLTMLGALCHYVSHAEAKELSANEGQLWFVTKARAASFKAREISLLSRTGAQKHASFLPRATLKL